MKFSCFTTAKLAMVNQRFLNNMNYKEIITKLAKTFDSDKTINVTVITTRNS